MKITFDNVNVFINFLKFFMFLPRKKQFDFIKNLKKELKSKCSK